MAIRERAGNAETFYRHALDILDASGVPYMIGGAWAMRCYAGIIRDTKDLDIFCTAGDYAPLLQALGEAGYDTQVTDASWLAKATEGEYLVDLIFNSANGRCPVDESWLERATTTELLDHTVKVIPPEEMIWSKSCVQDRHRYDGADVLHIIRERGSSLDWRHLLERMEPIWEILLQHLICFRFVYPSERDDVPAWLLRDLLGRVEGQMQIGPSQDRICRGPLLSRTQYQIDIEEWGYIAR